MVAVGGPNSDADPLNNANRTQYFYDAVGNLDAVRLPSADGNSVTTDYQYDALNRLTYMVQFIDQDNDNAFVSTSDTLIQSFDYELRADGKRSGVREVRQGENAGDADVVTEIDWIYDQMGRLAAEAHNRIDSETGDFIAIYRFDESGNRTAKLVDESVSDIDFEAFSSSSSVDSLLEGAIPPNFDIDEEISYTFDANDRLELEEKTSVADGSTTTIYEYDETQLVRKHLRNGTVSSGGSTIEDIAYDFNLQGRQYKVTDDDLVSTYEFNSNGVRVSQTVEGVTTVFLVDENNPTGYAQVLEQGTDATGDGLQAEEVEVAYTLGHDVIAQTRMEDAGPETQYLLYDGHGSTRALVEADGQFVVVDPMNLGIRQVFDYDAYGNLINMTASEAATSLLYSGEFTDAATGQQYLRARFYDPTTGRFNRLDPFSGNAANPQSLHKYAFVHGDPIQGLDPTGLFAVGLVGLGIGNFAQIKNAGVASAGKYAAGLGIHSILGASAGAIFQNIVGGFSRQSTGIGAYYGSILGAGIYIARSRGSLGDAIASGVITGAINSAIGVSGDLHEIAIRHLPQKYQLNVHPNHAPAQLFSVNNFSSSTTGTGLSNFFQGFAVGVWNEATEVFGAGGEFGDAALNFVDTFLNAAAAQRASGQPINYATAVQLGLVSSATDLVQAFMPDSVPDATQQLMAGAMVGAGITFLEAAAEAGLGVEFFDSSVRRFR
jgi:RHS repeat-associated protein